MRAKVLKQLHDSPSAGHPGQQKTLQLVTRDFWWPGVQEDVKGYVQACDLCQRVKSDNRPPAGLLHPMPTPGRPWEMVSIDFLTDLPASKGKTAVLIVVDMLTKMCHFVACPRAVSAEETARLFVDNVFKLHGVPSRVVSDRGRQFTSRFWRKLMELLGVELNLSTARHPQTNGQAERANAILQQYLRCYVSRRQTDWPKFLALAEFAYNNSVNVSTGMTPFLANYGGHPKSFPRGEDRGPSVPAAENFAEEMLQLHEQLKSTLDRAKEAYKRASDQHRREGEAIRVGDRVWLSSRGLPTRSRCRKLEHRRLGPFQVVGQVNPVAFKLRLPEDMRIHPVFHRALLTPYREGHPYQGEGGVTTGPSVEEVGAGNEATEILDSRWREGQVEYLVAWEGEDPENNTWMCHDNIQEEYLKAEFHALYPQKPAPPGYECWQGHQEEGMGDQGSRGGEEAEEPHPDWSEEEVDEVVSFAPFTTEQWKTVFESDENEDTDFLGFVTPPRTEQWQHGNGEVENVSTIIHHPLESSDSGEEGGLEEGVDVTETSLDRERSVGGGSVRESSKTDRQGEGARYREPGPLISTDTSDDDDSNLLEVSPEEKGSADVSNKQGEGNKSGKKRFTRHFRSTKGLLCWKRRVTEDSS